MCSCSPLISPSPGSRYAWTEPTCRTSSSGGDVTGVQLGRGRETMHTVPGPHQSLPHDRMAQTRRGAVRGRSFLWHSWSVAPLPVCSGTCMPSVLAWTAVQGPRSTPVGSLAPGSTVSTSMVSGLGIEVHFLTRVVTCEPGGATGVLQPTQELLSWASHGRLCGGQGCPQRTTSSFGTVLKGLVFCCNGTLESYTRRKVFVH